jgi:hypothetical protein
VDDQRQKLIALNGGMKPRGFVAFGFQIVNRKSKIKNCLPHHFNIGAQHGFCTGLGSINSTRVKFGS